MRLGGPIVARLRRHTVIYVAAEGAAGLKKRALAWFHHHGLPVPGNFFVLDMPLKIADPRVLRDFIEQVSELNPAFIILDTLGCCAVGLNENDPSSMGIFIDAAGQLAATTGAHVQVVHHNNKGGEYRGASSLPAGVDTHLSAERNGDTLTLKTEKQKDDDELEPLVFEKIVVPIPGSGGQKHSLVFRRIETTPGRHFSISEAERKVLISLADNLGAGGAASSRWKEAAAEKGISGTHYYRCQTRLLKMGAVNVVRGEQGKPGAIYVGNGNWPNPPESETTLEGEAANVADSTDTSAPIQAEIPLEDAAEETANRGADTTQNASETGEATTEFGVEDAPRDSTQNSENEADFDVETDPQNAAVADIKTVDAEDVFDAKIEPINLEDTDENPGQSPAQNGVETAPQDGKENSASVAIERAEKLVAEAVETTESSSENPGATGDSIDGETGDFSPVNDLDEGEVF